MKSCEDKTKVYKDQKADEDFKDIVLRKQYNQKVSFNITLQKNVKNKC